jgi:hypothetical protein
MRLSGLWLLLPSLILSSTLFGPVARAADADAPTVVLGLEALAGAPDSVAAEITDALRQRVAAAKGFQLLQGKDLVEVKLVFACPDEAPACMSQAGKSLGASKLIFGNVKQAGGDYQVTLKLLDVNRAVVESFTADTIPKKRADPSALRALAPGWMAKLTGKGGGSIQVRANFHDAAVSLDGTHVGTTGTAPVVINDVAPGHHEIAVEKSGYTTTKQEFTLAAGQTLPLNLTLSPVSVEVPRPEGSGAAGSLSLTPSGEPIDEGGNHTLTRTGFWVAVVGSLASAGLALKFGLDIRNINKQLDPFRRFPCSTSATQTCDVNGNPADPTLSQADLKTSHDLTNQGNQDQLLQWVFVGLSGAFAIAGGVLLYKGYLSSEKDQVGTQRASNHGLRIFPTASASAGGIIAEFDF